MNENIVIVEDDESIRMLLNVALSSSGYVPTGFDNASEALDYMRQTPPELVIMDIMMTGLTGIEALRLMRKENRLKTVPVIMLTAKDTEIDKIIGLDAGADDYVTKPFSVLELCARVRAQLRRNDTSENDSCMLTGGGLVLNTDTREVTVDNLPVALTFKEFELLKYLMEHSGKVLPREEILSDLWGEDFCGEPRTLDIHIGTLRQKLGDAAEKSRYVKTVRGVGYRFIGGNE